MPIKLSITDLKYVCLHEAGHAAATYAAGGTVEFIELLTGNARARGRTRANRPQNSTEFIAAAGFAIEYLLFKNNRLLAEDGTQLTENSFINDSMNNSYDDKISFFGADKALEDGTWPEKLDYRYMDFAYKNVMPVLRPMLREIEDLANTLEVHGKVEQEQIECLLGIR